MNHAYTIDIDDQPNDNYSYDKIGNLVQDGTGSSGKAIRWAVYPKITQVQKGDGTLVNYSYDASGNRISKSINGGKTTYYCRAAQGNVMGKYEQQVSNHLGNVMVTVSDIKQTGSGVNLPDVVSYNDYFPFGMQMLVRQYGIFDRHAFSCSTSCLMNPLIAPSGDSR